MTSDVWRADHLSGKRQPDVYRCEWYDHCVLIAVNGERLRCIQPPTEGSCSGRVACGGRSVALLLAAAGTCTSPQSTYSKAHSSMPPLCKVWHLRFTSDITRVMRSRAECRGSCDGLCERRIDGLDRLGIRRHLWWHVLPVSRQCTRASLGPHGITRQCTHTSGRGGHEERRVAPRS